MYNNGTLETVRGCGAFEEIEILRQICIGDCEWQGGKLLRLLSRFRPRILTLDSSLPEALQSNKPILKKMKEYSTC